MSRDTPNMVMMSRDNPTKAIRRYHVSSRTLHLSDTAPLFDPLLRHSPGLSEYHVTLTGHVTTRHLLAGCQLHLVLQVRGHVKGILDLCQGCRQLVVHTLVFVVVEIVPFCNFVFLFRFSIIISRLFIPGFVVEHLVTSDITLTATEINVISTKYDCRMVENGTTLNLHQTRSSATRIMISDEMAGKQTLECLKILTSTQRKRTFGILNSRRCCLHG